MRRERAAFAIGVTAMFLMTGCVAPTVEIPPPLGSGGPVGRPPLDPLAALVVPFPVGMTVQLGSWSGDVLTLPLAGAGIVTLAPEGEGENALRQHVTITKPLGEEGVNVDYPVLRYGDEVLLVGLDGRRLARLSGESSLVALPVAVQDGAARFALDGLAGADGDAAANDRWVLDHVDNVTGSLVVPSEPVTLRSVLDGTYLAVGAAGELVGDPSRSFNAFWFPTPPSTPPLRLDHAGAGASPPTSYGEGILPAGAAEVDVRSWFGTFLRPSSDPTKPVELEQGIEPTDGARWTLARADGPGRFRYGDAVTIRYRPVATEELGGAPIVIEGHANGRAVLGTGANASARWILVNPLDRFSTDLVRFVDPVAFRNEHTQFLLGAESDRARVSARAKAPYEYETWRLAGAEDDAPAGAVVRGGSSIRLLTFFGRFLGLGLGEQASLSTVGDGSPDSTDFRVVRVGSPTFTGPIRYGDRVLLSRGLSAFLTMDATNRTVGLGLERWADAMWTVTHPTDPASTAPLAPGSKVVLTSQHGLDVFAARRRGANVFEVGGLPMRKAGGSEIYTVGLVLNGVALGVPDASAAIRARSDVTILTENGFLKLEPDASGIQNVPSAFFPLSDFRDVTMRFFIRLRDEPLHGGALWFGDRVTVQDIQGRYLALEGTTVTVRDRDPGDAATFVVEGATGPAHGETPVIPGARFALRSMDRTRALALNGDWGVHGTTDPASVRWAFAVPPVLENSTTPEIRFGDPVKLRYATGARYLEALDIETGYAVRPGSDGTSPWASFVFVDRRGTTEPNVIQGGDAVFVRTMHGRYLESSLCASALRGCTTPDGHRRASIPSPGRNPQDNKENEAVRFTIDAKGPLRHGSTFTLRDDAQGGGSVGSFVIERTGDRDRGAAIWHGTRVRLEDASSAALRASGETVDFVPKTRDAWTIRAAVNVDDAAPLRYGDRVDIVDASGARLVPSGAALRRAVDGGASIPDGWRIVAGTGGGRGEVRDGDVVKLVHVDGGTFTASWRALDAPAPATGVRYGDVVRLVSDNGHGLVATDRFQNHRVRAEGAGTHSWETWTLVPLADQKADAAVRYREPVALKSRHGLYLRVAHASGTSGPVDAGSAAPFAWTFEHPIDSGTTRPVKIGDPILVKAGVPAANMASGLRGFWDNFHLGQFGHVDAAAPGPNAWGRWTLLPPSGIQSDGTPVQLGNRVVLQHALGKNLTRHADGSVGLVDGKGAREQWLPLLASDPGNRARFFYDDEVVIMEEAQGRLLGASANDKSALRWDLSSGPEGRRRWVAENPWGTLPMPIESGGESRFRLVEADLDGSRRYLHEAVRADTGHAIQTLWTVIDTGVRGNIPWVNGERIALVNDHAGGFLTPAGTFASSVASARIFTLLSAKAPSSFLTIEYGERVHFRIAGTKDQYLGADGGVRTGAPRDAETWIVTDPVTHADGLPFYPNERVAFKNLATGAYLANQGGAVSADADEAGRVATWIAMRPHQATVPKVSATSATASTARLVLPQATSPTQPLLSAPARGERPWFLAVPDCPGGDCPPATLVPFDAAPGERGAATPFKVDLPPPPRPILPPASEGGTIPVHTTPEAIIPVRKVDCRGFVGIPAQSWPAEDCRDFVLLLAPKSGRFMLNGPARHGASIDTLASFTDSEGALLPYRPGLRIEPISAIIDWIAYFSGARSEPPSLFSSLAAAFMFSHNLYDVSPSLDLQNTQVGFDVAVPLTGIGGYMAYQPSTGAADVVTLDRVTIYEIPIFLGSFNQLMTGYVPWWAVGGATVLKIASFWGIGFAFKKFLVARAVEKIDAVVKSNTLKIGLNFVPIGSHWAVDGVSYGLPFQQGYSRPPVSSVDLGKHWRTLVPFEHGGKQYVLTATNEYGRFGLHTLDRTSATSRDLANSAGSWIGYSGLTVFQDREGGVYALAANGKTARVAKIDLSKGSLTTTVETPLASGSRLVGLASWTHGVGYLAEFEGRERIAVHAVELGFAS